MLQDKNEFDLDKYDGPLFVEIGEPELPYKLDQPNGNTCNNTNNNQIPETQQRMAEAYGYTEGAFYD